MKNESAAFAPGEALQFVEPHCTLPSDLVVRLIERALEPVAAAPKPSARLDTLKKRGPWIGEEGLHGIYAGSARGYGGEKDGVLEVLAEAPEGMAWEAAKKWAESAGGRLPTRKEAALLFANVPELFKEEAYWTCEQYAAVESYAWYQGFGYGSQNCDRKGTELRARAVRRLPFE